MIDVIVVPRDRFSTFPRCLDALYAQTSEPFRLYVVAGAVDDATERELRRLQREKDNVRLALFDRVLEQGEARNIGLRLASERFCVVLENDTIVHGGWLAPLRACLNEEAAATVMPLVLWYRGIHATGGALKKQQQNGQTLLRHQILYSGLHRKPVDYPESHCILVDRQLLPGDDLFDDVEPFDVDLGLTLHRLGQRAFFEPGSVVTYSAPPPWEVRDLEFFKWRWSPSGWLERNRRFMNRWGVVYDQAEKYASYRRQQLKLGLARWYPSGITVGLSNLLVGSAYRVLPFVMRGRSWGHAPPPDAVSRR